MSFTPCKAPKGFNANVFRPGTNALKKLPHPPASKDFPPKWTWCLPALRRAFGEVCAYSSLRIDPITGAGTVDHYHPKVPNPRKAYRWRNYRYACQTMNRRKAQDTGICDPFAINDGDFVINFADFSMYPNPNLSGAASARVQHTITKLELDLPPMRAAREEAWKFWQDDQSSRGWQLMEKTCPLLAREWVRQFGPHPNASRPPPP
jgi:hypothetical protein